MNPVFIQGIFSKARHTIHRHIAAAGDLVRAGVCRHTWRQQHVSARGGGAAAAARAQTQVPLRGAGEVPRGARAWSYKLQMLPCLRAGAARDGRVALCPRAHPGLQTRARQGGRGRAGGEVSPGEVSTRVFLLNIM